MTQSMMFVLMPTLLLAGVAHTLSAQTSANAAVTATVDQPLSVSATNGLAFGNLIPGTNKTVAVTDAAAAAFTVVGQFNAPISMTFTIPATLSNGANTLPLASWTARRSATNSSASGLDFTPSAIATQGAIGGSGNLYVFVGATAQPSLSQVAGSYTGTLTFTVVYF